MTQAVALAQYGSTGVSQGFKNRIINGAMVIAQRGTSFSNPNGIYTVDRWFASCDVSATVVDQTSTAPTGFNNSLRWTNGTGATTPAGNTNYVTQFIEGFNVADLGFGAANAKTITVSFWVRSSVTGQYSIAITNNIGGSVTRSYITPYTISAANTWEQKSVTISGDTTGTWGITNGIGMGVQFDLGSGSNWNGTANAWQSGAFFSLSSNVNFHGTTNATWQVTGVQLEVGSTATSFDYRPYGTEFQLCQRYYQTVETVSDIGVPVFLRRDTNSNTYAGCAALPTRMRAAASVSYTFTNVHKPGVRFDTFGSVTTEANTTEWFMQLVPTTNDTNSIACFPRTGGFQFASEL